MKHGLNFVMGTTGGDRDGINEQNMQASRCKAVVAPNMAKQIVALQVTGGHTREAFLCLAECLTGSQC